MKQGRPESWNEDIADSILAEIASSSKSLKTICKNKDYPCVATVLKWLRTNESFLVQYARAKQEQADYLVEEMLDIADDASNDFMTIVKGDASYEVENKEWTSRSKLRLEARKWIASKLKPKKYGDKVDITSDNKALPEAVSIYLPDNGRT